MVNDEGPEERWSSAGTAPTEYLRQVFDALFKRVEQSTVVVGFYDEADCELKHGTGTCIVMNDHWLIATAGHHFVREPLPSHVGLWAPTMPKDQRVPAVLTHREGGLKRAPTDLAWLEVEPGYALELGRRFLTIDQLAPSFPKDGGEHLFIFGYAGEPTISDGDGGSPAFGLSAAGHWSTSIESSTIDPRHRPNPDIDIFMRYTRAVDDPVFGGLSGSGLWAPNLRSGAPWSPESARLVGVQHEALDAGRWVRGTRISHWLRPLADLYPDLRADVEHALAQERNV
jgi:hypothetical protein